MIRMWSVTNWSIKGSFSGIFSDQVAKFGCKNLKSGRKILKSALVIEYEIGSVLDFDKNYFPKVLFLIFGIREKNKKKM